MNYAEFSVPDIPTQTARFSRAHLKTVRKGGNGYSLCREQGKEISQVEKPLFNDK